MKKPAVPKQLLNKRIPTLLGIFVLVIALIAGVLLLGDGPGVFAPRATPTTTPKKIKITNVTDNSFTVSFITDDLTPAFVKYGVQASAVNSQASDDRDQLSGTVSDYRMHHITVRGLQPTTTYYYTLGTGSGTNFDNNGQPFSIQTTARSGAPAAAKTIYGSVSNSGGNPAEGTVVYVSLANAGEMSSLVKASGSWAVPLSNARTKDGSGYAQITDADALILTIQGQVPSDMISYTTTVADAQPVPTLTFGQTTPPVTDQTVVSSTPSANAVIQDTLAPTDMPITPNQTAVSNFPNNLSEGLKTATLSAQNNTIDFPNDSAKDSAESTQSAMTATSASNSTINLEKTEQQTVTTTQPKITGKAVPNVTVTIEVHSNSNIQQFITADENGNFELDIAALSKTLEPGSHEVTYSYTDPTSGQVVSKTVNFIVEDSVQQLALANQPYGSGNPYPPVTPTPTPTASASATPTPATGSASASTSAQASDSSRSSIPATGEGVPVSGSVGTTLALVFGGLFFIISGLWSFWISHQLGKNEIEY